MLGSHGVRVLAALILSLASSLNVCQAETRVTVTLDWVPSAEHYGFYYAQSRRLYENKGISVTIRNASGAAIVAGQLGARQISYGTTSSDNILRQLARGAQFSQLVPISRYNAVSLLSLPRRPIRAPSDIDNVTIGTNPQASPYKQFSALLQNNQIANGRYREYPIGYGGPKQLIGRQVDGFLGYTTNQTIEVRLNGHDPVELMFQDWGITSYSFVLVVGAAASADRDGVASRFVAATLEGYRMGGRDAEESARIMLGIEPSLQRDKVVNAIKRMWTLNETASKDVPDKIDEWVVEPDVDLKPALTKMREQLAQGLRAWDAER